MKEVLIVTFHKAHNYGAVLQAYALKNQLESLGLNTFIYDYSPEWLTEKYTLYKSFKKYPIIFVLRKYIAHFLDYKRRTRRFNGFEDFIGEHLSSNTKNIPSSIIDYIVVGSDQIWNPDITHGFDDMCFGIIPGHQAKKVISYAASMENIDRPINEISTFTKLLDNIDCISVREDSLKVWIDNNCNNKIVEHVLDPTLLIEKREWLKICKEVKINEKYILVYENYIDKNTKRISEEIASNLNLKIVTITPSASWKHPKEYLSGISPNEYLGLFKNASFVLTTSYHGLAFAINFSIPFLSLKVNGGVNRRADSLLKLLDLKAYLVDSTNFSYSNYVSIDFEKVNVKLQHERERSINFLKRSLGDVNVD